MNSSLAQSGAAIVARMQEASRGLPQRLRRPGLRTLLGAAAFAALLTTAALGTLLLATAGSARTVVETAQQTHDRVQAYSLLTSALRGLQIAAYADAHYRTPQTLEELRVARARYFAAMQGALRLPEDTPHRQQLASEIERRGHLILDHLAGVHEIVARIDEISRTEGRRAAGLEAERAAQPVRALESLLDREIHRGDEQIAVATDRASTLSRSVLLACIVCLCLAAGSWAMIHGLLLRRISPGLRRLEEGTRAFAAGKLDHRVGLGGHDELGQLSSAFDTMARLLAEKQLALQHVQLGLERAVHERTLELERANRELSVSDGRRRAFLADIGHELRTPLTIIRGEAQVALRTIEQPGASPQEALERIIEHTHDLSRMVEDLFLIARAEAGGLPMQIRPTDLRELTARVAADFEALANDAGASIRAAPGPSVSWPVDPDRLRRALAALVDNALRHTRDDVHVEIGVQQSGRGVLISVADDGPGIDPTLVPELFQRFRRGHTRGEGSGLGLSLVRALVEAQGGTARLENRAEGGALAVLEFPRRINEEDAGS